MSLLVNAVGDLTDEHIGWSIRVWIDNPLLGNREYVTVDGLRRWTYEGVERVGIHTKAERGSIWAGTESIYLADTACELVRQERKPRRAAKPTA